MLPFHSSRHSMRRRIGVGLAVAAGFAPSIPGLYVLEVTARVNNGSVALDRKKYDDVRHTATLSFEVPR